MASEIRVDKINSLSGVGTVTLSPTGVDIAGITTVATFKVGTGVTASSDGDIFATGVTTSTTFSGNFSGGTVSGTTGTFSGDVDIADTIVHTGDTNTKIRFPAADTVTVETGGSERVRVGSGGDVSIGGHATNYADSPLEVRDTNAGGDVAIRVTNNSTDAGSQAGVIFTTTTSDFTTAGIAYERGGTADALRFYVGQSSGAGGFDNATERLRIDSSGRIGIQGAPTKALLDVRASGGSATMLTAVFGANEGTTAGTLTDNTDKACRIGSYHYDNDEEPFGILVASGTNGTNNLTFGGGTSLMNAATEIKFNTAANSTTTSGTNRLTIDSSGNVEVKTGNLVIGTSGKGIDFSATSDASGMSSELLDDYEEGTFTPTFYYASGTSGVAYSVQEGRYTKVGRLVSFQLRLALTNKGSGNNHARIGGLPFTPAAAGVNYDMFMISVIVGCNLGSARTPFAQMEDYSGGGRITLYSFDYGSASDYAEINSGHLDNDFTCSLQGNYVTAS